MTDLNQYTCTGRLGADVEKRTFQNGDSVVNMRVAVSETWKSRDSGEKQERTLWLPVTIQNQGLCKVAENYLRKGSKVALSGKLQSRQYDKDGQTHTVVELVLGTFNASLVLLDGPQGGSQPERQERPSQSSGGPAFSPGGMDDSEIPFMREDR